MKKHITGMLVAAAAVMATASPSWAFKGLQVTTVTAVATTIGTPNATFTLKIRDVVNPMTTADRTQVTFPSVDPLTVGGWTIANQLLLINSTVTANLGGIKIYTDNRASDANPRFVPPTSVSTAPTSVAAGLLKVPAVGTDTSEAPVPMAWSIKSSSRTVGAGDVNTGIGAADPVNGPTGSVRDNKFQWLFITDESNWASGTDFNGDGDVVDAGDANVIGLDLDVNPADPNPSAEFVTMINKVGIHFGQDNPEFGAHPDGANAFVYLEANFQVADPSQQYKTTALRVEAFVQ